jgi:hypothetical protein
MLKDFYAAANVSEKALEIVYVSSDGSEADMYSTMQVGDAYLRTYARAVI